MRKKDRRSAVISLLRSVGEQLRKTKNPPLSRDAEALGDLGRPAQVRRARRGPITTARRG